MDTVKNQTFGGRIWQNSASCAIMTSWLRKCAKAKNLGTRYGLPKWKPVLESLLILLIAFMPIIQSWELILPLLVLLWLSSGHSVCPVAKELFGLWFAVIASAVLSSSFRIGLSSLITFSFWLGITYLGSKVFSPEFVKKFLGFFCLSSLFWIIISFWQQISGIPTPSGWLGSEVINWIKVRSYSVFGNPNIFALYLLIILVISSDSIIFFTGCLKTRDHFLKNQGSSKHRLPQGANDAGRYDKSEQSLLWMNLLSHILVLSFASVALYYTYSRFAWFLGIIFLGLRFWPYFGKRRWFLAAIFLVFLCTIQGFKIRMGPLLSLTDSSMRYRIHIWQGVLKAVSDYWLWGSGPGSFGKVYPWYQISNTISVHAHQLYLQIWLENGIVSLMAYLWLFRKMLASCWRIFNGANGRTVNCYQSTATSPAASSSVMIIIIFLGYGLTESWTQNQLISGYFWLFCGLWISSVMSYK